MPDQKTDEKSNKEGTELNLSELSERDLVMMNLKILGLKYRDIAAEMLKQGFENISENTVKKAFYSEGHLKDVYEIYKKKRLEEIESESLDLAKAHLKTAFECLVSVMGQRDQHGPRVSAAIAVIERILGKPMNINYNINQKGYDEDNDIFKQSLDEKRKEILGGQKKEEKKD